jgi:NAD(P)-dependent dehydrogenase (short-subunit alcohol dehydrogenase family)
MTTALVLGANGGVGSEVCQQLQNEDHLVIKITGAFDFSKDDAAERLSKEINIYNPTWIFNCAGVLGTNEATYRQVYDVNVGSNWALVQHYLRYPVLEDLRIVMMGSTAHIAGKPEYMLYSSSKAALDNLYRGAVERLPGIKFGLIHPGPINTKMIAHIKDPLTKYLEPGEVAARMITMCKTMTVSQTIIMRA